MWYGIDFVKLVVQMLPPLLRSRLLVAFLRVLTVPLRHIHELFLTMKEGTDDKLSITGNVQYLEKALNDAFCLTEGQIHIVTPVEERRPAFYLKKEEQSRIFHTLQEGTGYMVLFNGETRQLVNFTVRVPTFLCTSTESKQADKYGWRHYRIIKNILNIYKPAGRTFGIELYDYE
ncbi:hypothetical protein [Xylanibacter muris]|uniref:Uncharacterized protein n=1 Tax=Xylanibacter muris TaxID=2736290 RepID=A0ABX2AP58_9BACT|nr:hypothetical protein [Xylanibacter muris]NPD91706.1 hypothetical protein [Xylanibacter muris]